MAVICVLMMVLGMFLEAICILVIVVPTIFPLAVILGIDPIQFGLLMVVGLGVGELTPPVGIIVFLVAKITEQDAWPVFRQVIPLLMAAIVILVAVALYPPLTTWLPGFIAGW